MPEQLKPFDPASVCPKCGHGKARTSWSISYTYPDGTRDSQVAHESLARFCERCGYSWEEAPLDAQQPKAKRPLCPSCRAHLDAHELIVHEDGCPDADGLVLESPNPPKEKPTCKTCRFCLVLCAYDSGQCRRHAPCDTRVKHHIPDRDPYPHEFEAVWPAVHTELPSVGCGDHEFPRELPDA